MKPYIFFFSAMVVCGAAMLLFAPSSSKIAASGPNNTYAKSAQAQSPLSSQPAISPSEKYIDRMVKFQLELEGAFHAGLCGLRGEGYLRAFQIAQVKLSLEAAQQLGLSQKEAGKADTEVNRRFAKIHEGLPQFDPVEGGCAYFRNSSRLVELDALYLQIRE
jgi:hypothetical protein